MPPTDPDEESEKVEVDLITQALLRAEAAYHRSQALP